MSFSFSYLPSCFYLCFFKKSSSEVKASVTNFLKLVNTLMDDQCQRDIFYQVSWLLLFHILSLLALCSFSCWLTVFLLIGQWPSVTLKFCDVVKGALQYFVKCNENFSLYSLENLPSSVWH